MNILNKYISLVLLLMLVSCKDSDFVPLKSNINIQIDGHFNRKEDWNEGHIININYSTTLYAIQDHSDLFVGIKNSDGVNKYVDLFIENDSIGTLNLHASMQLGERLLIKNWNDTIPDWNWGNNDHWVANNVKVINHNESISFQESIESYQGFEFKISKGKIKNTKIRLRIEVKDFLGQANDIIFPSNSERMNKENWHWLLLK